MQTPRYPILAAVLALHVLLILTIRALRFHYAPPQPEDSLTVQTILLAPPQRSIKPIRITHDTGSPSVRTQTRRIVEAPTPSPAVIVEHDNTATPSAAPASPTLTESALHDILKLDSGNHALGADTAVAQLAAHPLYPSEHDTTLSRAISGAAKVDCLDQAKQGQVRMGQVGVSGLLMAVPEALKGATGHGC